MTKERTINNRYFELVTTVLENCRSQNYAGYSKFDALNSPVLERLSFNNPYVRILFIQLVKECPWHIRPYLGVKKSRNPKGIALFSSAYLSLFEATGEKEFLNRAEELLGWLIANRYPKNENFCWGYNFIWQAQIFGLERYEPNAVVTVFTCEALIQAFRLTGKQVYLDAALSGARFLLNDLAVLHENEDERAVSYVQKRATRIVLNTQVLTGGVFVKLYNLTKDPVWLKTARKQYDFTVNRRIKDCTWNYAFPVERYHAVDNYHTGGVLDSLVEFYEETGDDRYMDLYWRGLEYYKTALFEPDGAPRWMDNKRFPYDIHGAAQGIISFVKASRYREQYLEFAERICDWTLANMYRPERKEFIYRIGRFTKWEYSLMRWCNAWMSKAMTDLAKRVSVHENREEKRRLGATRSEGE